MRTEQIVKLMAWTGIVAFAVMTLNETVFNRETMEAYQFNFQPFWSYEAIMNGRKDLIKEHYLNVVLFIPLGILVWVVLKRKQWWRTLASG